MTIDTQNVMGTARLDLLAATDWFGEVGVKFDRTGRDIPGSNWHVYPVDPDGRRNELVELEGVRSYIVIPMFRGEDVIGTINLYRRDVKPFDAEQIESGRRVALKILDDSWLRDGEPEIWNR